ncbi:MAG: glycosyltransferase family 1 protein [Verrucomicrobiae bacterium]|nr:glycosyltransferase family 1 protein [Verrucomicrobiae bacterium]
MDTSLTFIMQPNLSSGLGLYIADEFIHRGFEISVVNALGSRRHKIWPCIKSLSFQSEIRWNKRNEYTLFSTSAWHRNTKLNGRLLDHDLKPGMKILQVGKEYFPHPDYRNMEYYVFIHYTMKCSVADGVTPWIPAEYDRKSFYDLEGELYRYARHVFVGGEYLKRHLVADYGVNRDKVTVVGGGVNDFFLKHKPDLNELKESRTCLFVGWDFGMKGGKDLIEAFTIARKAIPGLRLLVVGPQREEVPLCDGVECIGPVRDKAKLLYWYRQADLFVMPSLRDSFGFVFLEAMSQGLPCIGTRLNAMPEIIRDQETGYLVKLQDTKGLSEAIIQYYEHTENRYQMGLNAIERVHTIYTWEKVVSTMIEIMNEDYSIMNKPL